MIFCTKCGNKIQGGEKFCNSCGATSPQPSKASTNANAGTKKASGSSSGSPLTAVIPKKLPSKKFLIPIAGVAVALILFVIFSGNGIPNGRFVPSGAHAPYSFVEFSGNSVTIGMLGGMMNATGTYTFNNGVLRFSAQGQSFDFGVDVVNRNTLILTIMGSEFEYVRE